MTDLAPLNHHTVIGACLAMNLDADELLMDWTGETLEACHAALQAAEEAGYIDALWEATEAGGEFFDENL